MNALLPHRSFSAVKSKITDWRQNKDKNLYMDILGDEIKEVLAEHTIAARWTKENIDELIEATKKVGFRSRDLKELIPRRTEAAICRQLIALRKE